jgi:hypothetical protein
MRGGAYGAASVATLNVGSPSQILKSPAPRAPPVQVVRGMLPSRMYLDRNALATSLMLCLVAACDVSEQPSNGDATASTGADVVGGGMGGTNGTGGAASGGSGGAACQGPTWPSNSACEACQNEKCCITGGNCAADPECIAMLTCKARGGGSACNAQHPDGIWNFSGLAICLQNSCASECGVAQAKCGGIQPTPASCTDEIQAACCKETAACGTSDACLAFVYQCIDQNQCTDMACYDDCRAKYPDAARPFDAMAACWQEVSCL